MEGADSPREGPSLGMPPLNPADPEADEEAHTT